MNNISVKTQNIKGSTPQYKDNLGYSATFLRHSEDIIIVDDFEGFGEDYKQREITEITIVQNGAELFKGSKHELFEILKNLK